ncbi:hypothetical protein ACFSCX_05825 [Bacillus salitolerans]|uniref:Uncharacterized protein n=1 Tax=Bacillus salitolerans TaxID=1437434 RepID=A0ABW4LLM6_9BACI
MNPITDKQQNAINVVENVLQITFEGNTKQEAFLWLREHVPKAKKTTVLNPVTDKQKHAINLVENILRVTFTGTTKQQAFLWLQEFVPKAVNAINEHHSLWRGVQALANFDSMSKLGIPEGLDPYPDELTPTMESLRKRIAIDSLLVERF